MKKLSFACSTKLTIALYNTILFFDRTLNNYLTKNANLVLYGSFGFGYSS